MNEADLYSGLMNAWGHAVGWGMILLVLLIVFLGRHDNPRLFSIMLLAWSARVGFAIYNTYIHTGYVDSFESSAYEDSSLGFSYVMQGIGANSQLYTWFCSMFYLGFGRSPLLLQGINILLEVLIVSNCYKIADLIFGPKVALRAAVILAFFPAAIIFSTAVIREAVWVYPATLGVLWWVQGQKENRVDLILLAIIPYLVAYAFHAGALGLVLAWLCTPIVSRISVRDAKQYVIKGIIIFVIVVTGSALVDSGVLQSLNGKFDIRTLSADDVTAGLETAADSRAVYLANMHVSASPAILWQFPVRFLYFIGMPFPWYIRTPIDVGGCVDGLFYLCGLIIVGRNWKKLVKFPGFAGVLLACVATWGIFSYGTANYGTAIRHRAKVAPLACVLFCGAWEVSRRKADDPFRGLTAFVDPAYHRRRQKPAQSALQ
jgi:hypothetical protein